MAWKGLAWSGKAGKAGSGKDRPREARQAKGIMKKTVAQATQEEVLNTVDSELLAIHNRHGKVNSQLILKVASDEGHPLHSYFEWDDTAAAQKYRTQQAYNLLLGSKMVATLVAGRKEVVVQLRTFLPANTERKGQFTMRNKSLNDDEVRKQIIKGKLETLHGWCNSVIDIDELSQLRTAVLRGLGKHG